MPGKNVLTAWVIVVLFFVAQAVCLYATFSRRPDTTLVSNVPPLTPLPRSSSYEEAEFHYAVGSLTVSRFGNKGMPHIESSSLNMPVESTEPPHRRIHGEACARQAGHDEENRSYLTVVPQRL